MTSYCVLMSVYKKESPVFLSESIDSMLSQTLLPQQFVLVKDGPLEYELDEVIDNYVCKYPCLFDIVSINENVGLGAALDIGLTRCKHELVARMDTDDISLPTRCAKQVAEFEADSSLCIVGSAVDEFEDDKECVTYSRAVPLDDKSIKQYVRRRSPFNHSVVMFKKTEVIRCGGYKGIRNKQDYDLFSRMLNQGCKGKNLGESLLLCRSSREMLLRRKSFQYTSSYIRVQKMIYQRGDCGILDLVFVWFSQTIIRYMPLHVFRWISNNFLRKKKGLHKNDSV